MTYEKAKQLLEEKKQTQLLRYYDELDETGKQNLLVGIENIVWDFEKDLANPVDLTGRGRDIRPIDGLKIPAIEARKAEFESIGIKAIQNTKVAAVLLAGVWVLVLAWTARKAHTISVLPNPCTYLNNK